MADKEPSREARELAAQIERDGGRILALYQEPIGEHWQIFCLLPRAKCEASPYQRDLSPTHVKRLTESIKRLDRFVDPIVIISPRPGVYWTPNGNHRRAVLDKLKADFIPAILVVEPEMVFEVLRRVDKFLKQSLAQGLPARIARADLVRAADAALGVVVAKIKKRGINHPYVKNYALARTTPLTRARKTLPSFEQTFKKLKENLEEFDVAKVRYDDIQRSSIMHGP